MPLQAARLDTGPLHPTLTLILTLTLTLTLTLPLPLTRYADNTPNEPTGGMPVPSKSWPTAGRVVMSELCVRYRPELPLALRGVSCVIEPRSKVGIVGRTG